MAPRLMQCKNCLKSKMAKEYRRIRDSKAKTTYPELCRECEPPLNRYVEKTCVDCNRTGFSKEMFGGKDKNICKECRRTNEEKSRTDPNRNTFRRTRHGLSNDIYERMLADQDYKCAICKKQSERNVHKRDLFVDHDHTCCPGSEGCSSCVRQLLCHHCNVGLGFFQDDIETMLNAVGYLKSWKG